MRKLLATTALALVLTSPALATTFDINASFDSSLVRTYLTFTDLENGTPIISSGPGISLHGTIDVTDNVLTAISLGSFTELSRSTLTANGDAWTLDSFYRGNITFGRLHMDLSASAITAASLYTSEQPGIAPLEGREFFYSGFSGAIAPVPLPATIWLFASVLAAGWLTRRTSSW